MRKLFLKFSVLLFVLGMSTNAAWANFDANPYYVAQMTASVSSTGGGKVYLDAGNDDSFVPDAGDYVESVTKTKGLALSMQGMDRMRVAFKTWQIANDGYYFAGWSYADNGFDLGKRKPAEAEQDFFYDLYDVGTEKSTYRLSDPENESSDPVRDDDGNVIYEEGEYFPAVYTLYATFEPVRISGYRLSGSNTTVPDGDNKVCTQTVTFTFSGEDIDVNDFNAPAIVPADAKWTVNNDFAVDGTAKTGSVTVTFSTNEANHTTSSANLRLTTKAGVSINITLDARTATASGKDLALYDGKTYKADIDFADADFASKVAACAKPIIKLNKNYNSALTIDKNLTLDLCGYTIGGLTVSAGKEVTLAFSPYGGTITGAVVNNGTLTLAGGTLEGALTNYGTLYQNGTTVNGAVTNNGTMTTTDGVHAQTVTTNSGSVLTVNGGQFVPASGVAIDVKANATAVIKKGTIEGKTYGVQSAGSTTIEKLAVISGGTQALKQTAGTLTVNCGKFTNPTKLKDGTIVFNSGYFQEDGNQSSIEGKKIWRNTSGAEFRENYLFFAGDANAAKAAGVSVCHIGGTSYSALEDALAYANTTSDQVIIIMDNDYTLPAGYYTLPANAVLIVPKDNDQGNETKTVERAIYAEGTVEYVAPTKFRCLTLSEGVNLDVHGTIEVSGTQYSSHQAYTSAVYGPYGQLQLNKGSKITLQNGSELRAWGYVTGDIASQDAEHHVPMGEIDARRGSTVREQFQMGDWKGAAFSGMGLLQGNPVFPLNTYFIQNIEVPVKYHPGAVLSTAAGVTAAEGEWGGYASAVSGFLGTANISMSANDIKIIGVTEGEPAMFLMDAAADAENTWVRKWYDASKDQQVYEINSGAHIGNLIIPLVSSPFFSEFSLGGNTMPEDLTMNSGQYFLPITNNFKLHLLSGVMDFTQSTELLPGAEVEIDKESRIYITPTANVNSGALFVYDAEDWGNYAGGVPARKVKYAPAFDDGENNGVPSTRGITMEDLEDATVLVHGTFEITEGGYVYTSEKVANITSTNEDAGTFAFFADNTEANVEVSQVSGAKGGSPEGKTFYPAKLRNGDDTFVETSGVKNMQTIIYLNDKWIGDEQLLLYLDCFTAEADAQKYYQGEYEDAIEKIYIKPQEYVEIAYSSFTVTGDADALSLSVEGNPDHTYSDAAGEGRLFILLTDAEGGQCQWWEVENVDNLYHCTHPENDTYYEWNGTKWVEKKFTITWKDWDGSLISTYSVSYGTQAEWLSTNPTRPANKDYTYDFTGWSPALGRVTGDVTYTATYEEKQIKYTVVFVQDGGVEIERHLLARDEVPVCENVPTRTGYILQWEPGIEPVVGNQTYTATWLPEPPDTFMVTFKNYDGTEILKYTGTGEHPAVEAGVAPTPPAADPSKPQTNEYTYAFTGWKGPKGFTAKNETLPVATENATYVAQYSENARTYAIKFYDENVSSVLKSENLEWGATPTPPAVSKTKTGYSYTYVWQNKDDASKSIESVKGEADYKPVFTETKNKYTVKLQCNLPGKCSFAGAGIYDYGTSATIVATPADGYEFVKWQERTGGANLGSVPVDGDITLTAVVKETAKPDPENLTVDINGSETVSPATDYMDVTITSDGLAHSGQIIGADNINLYGNADFILSKSISKGLWYCVAVPWKVEANGGIYLGNDTKPAVLGTDIEIIYYDGSVRAAQGKVEACWVWMKKLSTKKILEPGRAYMIYLKRKSVESITFRKKVQEPILTTGTNVQSYPSANDLDAGWNAIANPSLFYAFVNAGSTDDKAQRYNSADDSYSWFNLDEHKLVVGEPIYVQAPAAKSIVVVNGAAYAPRRAKAQAVSTKYEVSVTAAGATKFADHLSITLNEDKEADKYIIGQDLVKFGVSTKVAQMWVDRYDAKLCVNAVAPEYDATTFPMSVYAPKAGDYTITIEREVNTEDYALYLTYDGEAIWDLTKGAYVANLQKGTDARYGLRISAKVPHTATGIDEALVENAGDDVRKVLVGDQIRIIRGNKVYTIDGKLVK